MEFNEQGDLRTSALNNPHLSENQIKSIMKNLIEALIHVHHQGYIHRDVKPANILLTDESRENVKLCDFGSACQQQAWLIEKCGTSGYIAPEILRGEFYDSKVDIFSAGISLYNLLLGSEPSSDSVNLKMVETNKSYVLDYDNKKWDTVSDSAKDLIKKMTTNRPKDRIDAKTVLKHSWFSKIKNKKEDNYIYSLDSLPLLSVDDDEKSADLSAATLKSMTPKLMKSIDSSDDTKLSKATSKSIAQNL
jgi:serine/threonine protein kinase